MKFCHSYSSFIFFGSGSVHRYKRCSIRKFIIEKIVLFGNPIKLFWLTNPFYCRGKRCGIHRDGGVTKKIVGENTNKKDGSNPVFFVRKQANCLELAGRVTLRLCKRGWLGWLMRGIITV